MPHARIYLIIAKEPLGVFKAIAVKAEDGRRAALLSESGPTLHEALQLLFVRSAEAVEHHLNTAGFDFVLAKDEDGDDSDFDAHLKDDDLSSDGSLSDDETVSIASQTRNGSSVPPARLGPSKHGNAAASGANKANVRRPRSFSPSSARSRSRSWSSSSSSGASSRGHSRRRPGPGSGSGSGPEPPHIRWRAHTHGHAHPGYGLPIRPPHMHVAPWRSDPNLPRHPFAAHPPVFVPAVPPVSLAMAMNGNTGVAPPPPFPPPPQVAVPQNHTPPSSSSSPFSLFPPPPPPPPPPAGAGLGQRFKASPDQAQIPCRGQDIRLLIRWCGSGEQREQHVLEHCPLTMRALQNAAVAYVRCNPDIFSCVSPSPPGSSKHENASGSPLRFPGMLRATVRRIIIGTGDESVEYDVTSYPGEDLQGLVDCVETGTEKKMGIPQVEVDVTERVVNNLGDLNSHLFALENGVSMKDVCKDSTRAGNRNGNGNVSGLAAELAALQRKTQRPTPADMRAQAAHARARAQNQARRNGPGFPGSGIPPDALAQIPPDVAAAARNIVPLHVLAQAKAPGQVAVMTANFSQAATQRSLSPPCVPMVKKDGITGISAPAPGLGQRV